MIPYNFIQEWSAVAPWPSPKEVEQDLLLCRALTEIFNDEYLATHLAFRGGTALNKLYFHPQTRYSEDIDLVQINPEPIKETFVRLRKALAFMGEPTVKQKRFNNLLLFKLLSSTDPAEQMRIKVETNCREHFHELPYNYIPYSVESSWYSGSCKVLTYKLEELMGTKVRALYQRTKGRDFFDLYKVLSTYDLNVYEVLRCFRRYISFVASHIPTQTEYMMNLDSKMQDSEFLGDLPLFLSKNERFDANDAYALIVDRIISKM
jgi:predicted nucleotidyltransferase component of viral defense system